MILILGGTHEGAQIAHALVAHKIPYILTVATSLGLDYYSNEGLNTLMVRFDKDTLKAFIRDHQVDLIIDATHPHANEITKIARLCAKSLPISYWRYERKQTLEQMSIDLGHYPNLIIVPDITSAIDHVSQQDGNLLMTGAKHIQDFYEKLPAERCYFRIMPSRYSITLCEDYKVPLDHIIGIKAPCPPRLTQSLFEAYHIQYFIFKQSGLGSATQSNLQAIQDTSIVGIMIESPLDQSANITSFDTVESIITATVNKIKTFHKNMKQL